MTVAAYAAWQRYCSWNQNEMDEPSSVQLLWQVWLVLGIVAIWSVVQFFS